MDLASATPLDESKFSGEQTTVTTSSLNTMGTRRKHKSADDDRMQRRLSQERRSWELDVGDWERAANSTINTSWSEWWSCSRVSSHIQWEWAHWRSANEPPEWDLWPWWMREGCERDSYARGRENRFLVEDERRETISSGESNAARPRFITSCGSPRDTVRQNLYGWSNIWAAQTSIQCLPPRLDLEAESLRVGEVYGWSSSADSSMPIAGHRTLNVHEVTYHRAEHDDSRRWLQHSKLINLLEAEHILQIRELSGHEEQRSRSFHETPWRIAYKSTCEEIGNTLSGYGWWWYERGYGRWWYERERPMMTTDCF